MLSTAISIFKHGLSLDSWHTKVRNKCTCWAGLGRSKSEWDENPEASLASSDSQVGQLDWDIWNNWLFLYHIMSESEAIGWFLYHIMKGLRRQDFYFSFLLAPSGALIAIPTYYWSTPLFQITPVLNTGLSLSEPLQLYKGYNAI